MDNTMREDHQLGLQELLVIARRRWLWILVPFVLGPIVGYLISLKITPVYTSQAVVLVEQQRFSGHTCPPPWLQTSLIRG
jgi:uncharacterized protein involved in exopolysaccharide biosynthesis